MLNAPEVPSAARKLWPDYRAWVDDCNPLEIERLNIAILSGMLLLGVITLGWWPTDQWEPALITRMVSIVLTAVIGLPFIVICLIRFDVHLTKDAQRYSENAARDAELERLRKQVAEPN